MAIKRYELDVETKDKILEAIRKEGFEVPPGNHTIINKRGFLVEITYEEEKELLTVDLQKNPPFLSGLFWSILNKYYKKAQSGDFTA